MLADLAERGRKPALGDRCGDEIENVPLSLGQRVSHEHRPPVVLNALTVLNTSSPCQFFCCDFATIYIRGEDLPMSWIQVIVTAAAALAAMRAAIERGDLDEAARQGALAGPAVVERALASRDRRIQLAAIAASPIVQHRAELLAPLARLA
ncbi:MAG TPA: hypothetical protein VF469_01660, partial [Kofleriaceae bacterium]